MQKKQTHRGGRAVAVFTGVLLLQLVVSPILLAGKTSSEEDTPLAFLEPFMGLWHPHPDWEPLDKNPELRSLVPLNLQWNEGRTSVRIEEGLPHGSELSTTGILVWNPVSQRAEFLAEQSTDNLVFDGYYEPVDAKTIRRVYDVIDPSGDVRLYRETFHLRPDGVLDWTTERQVDGAFQPVSGKPGPEFQAIRPSSGGKP
ncbi:MAG: hypothetical protein AAF481_16475 [Acidobacteriota bacterium]